MHTESEAQAKNKQSRKKTCPVKMLLRCLFNVKTAQYVKCDGIHVGTLQGPAVMDEQCSKQKRQIIVSLRTASVPLILHSVKTSLTLHDTNPLSRRLTVHFRGKRQWEIDAGISVGTFCDNLSTAIWSKSVPT